MEGMYNKVMMGYLGPPLVVFGLIGNFFSFLIYSSKRFKNASIGLYFRGLAISDSICLVIFITRILKNGYGFNITKINSFLCISRSYAIYVIGPTSAYILAAISIDRMIMVCNPSFRLINKKAFQLAVIFLIIVFNLLYYTTILVYRKFEINVGFKNGTYTYSVSCNYKEFYQVSILYWQDIFNSAIIPFLIMITSTLFTSYSIFKSRNKINPKVVTVNKRKQKLRDMNFAFTSVASNILFLILNLPLVVYYIASEYVTFNSLLNEFMDSVFAFLFYSNFASMFFINFAINKLFKEEFSKIIGFAKPNFSITISLSHESSKKNILDRNNLTIAI